MKSNINRINRGQTTNIPFLPASKPVPAVVVLDTCVLISNVLRRVLLRLVDRGLFRPAWSPVIGDEWRRNAARIWAVDSADIAAQWDQLQEDYPDADQGDVGLYKEGLRRSDPKDWHVVAAGRAVRERLPGAEVAVVTRNLKDFNRSELRGFGLGVLDPDELLVRCWLKDPVMVGWSLREIEGDFAAVGREAGPLAEVLRRERLFRLNRLLAAG